MADEQNKSTENTNESGETQTKNTSDEKTYGDFEKGFSKGFAKATEKAETKLLSELGIDNLDSVKNLLQTKKEQDEAQKSELDKTLEKLQAIEKEREDLAKTLESTKFEATINSIAATHGITELDYFKMEYNKSSGNENFEVNSFIESLRESKPFVFGQKPPPKTDKTSNNTNEQDDFSSRVKKAKTRAELDALYNELKR